MSISELTLDSLEVGAFERELEFIENRVIELERPKLLFANGSIVPLEFMQLEWALATSYRIVTGVGMFELARDYTTNLPLVNQMSEEIVQPTYKYVGGYHFSEEEAAAAVRSQMPLEQQKIKLVNDIAQETLNKLIAFGDQRAGLYGFINHPAWLRSYAAYPINATSSPTQILSTLKAPITAQIDLTSGKESPDTLLLPYKQYEYAIDARVSEYYDNTILRQFLKNNGHVKNIQPLNELKGAGTNGEDVMIYFTRDPSKVQARVTSKFRFRELKKENFGWVRPAAFRYGGIVPYFPYSVHVVEGI